MSTTASATQVQQDWSIFGRFITRFPEETAIYNQAGTLARIAVVAACATLSACLPNSSAGLGSTLVATGVITFIDFSSSNHVICPYSRKDMGCLQAGGLSLIHGLTSVELVYKVSSLAETYFSSPTSQYRSDWRPLLSGFVALSATQLATPILAKLIRRRQGLLG